MKKSKKIFILFYCLGKQYKTKIKKRMNGEIFISAFLMNFIFFNDLYYKITFLNQFWRQRTEIYRFDSNFIF